MTTSPKKDYAMAAILNDCPVQNHQKLYDIMGSDNTLEELYELATESDLNLKAQSVHNQRMIESFDGKHPVQVVTRYVLTDERLVSPTGFHPSELIFSQNNVMIQTDRLPRRSNLKCYDMTKIN